jgi:toxin ParE1/3/4
MSNAILVRPEAEADISEAFRWYEDRSQELGFEFRRVLDVCVLSVQRNPFAFPAVHGEVRRALLRRFPYGIFYTLRRGRDRHSSLFPNQA